MNNLNRRQMLIGASIFALSSCATETAPDVPSYSGEPGDPLIDGEWQPALGPKARLEPVRETFFGETVTDPYRWMENADDPDWTPFMSKNAEHARSTLDRIQRLGAMRGRISEITGAYDETVALQIVDDLTFYEMRPAGAQSTVLFMRGDGTNEPVVLIDPSVRKTAETHISLDWWSVSPDAKHVVYGMSEAGSEDSVLHILNVETLEILPERIDRTQFAFPSWLPDSSGFFYNRLTGSAGNVEYFTDSGAWLHRLNSHSDADISVLRRGQYNAVEVEPTDFPYIDASISSEFVVATLFGGVRPEIKIWTARLDDLLNGVPDWNLVATLEDAVTGFAFSDDRLFMLTNKDAVNGQILSTPLSHPSYSQADLVLPESATVIDEIALAYDGLYVRQMDGGYASLIKISDPSGQPEVSTIPLPFEGSVEAIYTSSQASGAVLHMSSWLEPIDYWKVGDGVAEAMNLSASPPVDLDRFEATRTFAIARDGTKIPLSIISKKGMSLDGSAPALVDAYGSYQVVSAPIFVNRGIAFLEQGGVLATAHVRGGGEYGRAWWKAGQKLTKPNSWRDLIDCCEHLIAEGWTASDRLAIMGGSAGGITVGMALAERPELFSAVIPKVGVLNALRAEFSQNGPPNIAEFGTVGEEDGFKSLKAMDALHHIEDETEYPAVLLTHGMNDSRVEPWHSAKMVARLRAANPTGGPFLLRVTFDSGHGLGSTRSQLDEEFADIYSFVLWQAGTSGFEAMIS